MSRRSAAGLAGLAAAVVLAAGCGVRTQDEPEILRTPPPAPTATPTADEEPSGPGVTASPSTGGATPSPATSGAEMPSPSPSPSPSGGSG